RVLPFAIMGMLVVYCLRNTALFAAPYGIPELIACLSVVLLHIWKRNSLLSIGGGTLIYMLLVQFVF
ncbi:MAG: AzlD domain-containing protein, partial [Christensenellaceae bacterium]|nr:AzlD domain-containing protein [Christensenellaceae bacterium]